MEEGLTIFVVIALLCATIFIGLGIFSIQKRAPMHFWSGITVKAEEISDIRSYNKENGIMWISYGATYILSAILTVLFGTDIGAIIIILSCTVGLIALVLVYKGIYKKYSVAEGQAVDLQKPS